VRAEGYPISPVFAMRASRTARAVASPAAQLFREPVLGAVPADRVAQRAGAKLTVAAGLAITGAGLAVGATTAIGSSQWFVAAWMAIVGFGMGTAFATAASAALKTIPAEKSGVASAMMQAMQKVGFPLGSAIVGSVLVTGYQAQLNVTGLPAAAASVVKQSVFAGVAVAGQVHSSALLDSVRSAFVAGMDAALVVSAATAAVAMVLALIFLPGRLPSEARSLTPVAERAA